MSTANTANSAKVLGIVGALIAVTAWGGSFISTKMLLNNNINAVEIYIFRFLIAYVLTLILCPRPLLSHSWSDELKFVLCGICGGSIYFIAENTAVVYTLVSNVSLIVATAPLITALLLGLFYRNERPSKGVLIGSSIAMIGVACVIFNSSVVVKVNPLGDLLALLAAVCWAIYTILLRPLNATYSMWFVSRKTFFYGVITALPFLGLEQSKLEMSAFMEPEVWGNLLFLGVVASMISYLLWSLCIRELGAMKASNFLYLSPIVTLVLSAVILHENVSWIGYTGCALILAGLWLSEKLNRQAARK